jgi:dihydroxyacetone kinase-like predicted kinase
MIGVSSGDGIDEMFKEVGINYIVKGGQTMNPSSEDFVKAIKNANAEYVYIFPNNSNIVMAASQACEIVEDVKSFVIPSKTILQGISSAIRFNPEISAEENFKEMKSALKNIKSGEVTFSIRDTEINGIHINKDDFIGIVEKEIVISSKDKFETICGLISKMIDDISSIITIIYGSDVSKEEALKVQEFVSEQFPDLDIDLREGNQPVYSFLVGVE